VTAVRGLLLAALLASGAARADVPAGEAQAVVKGQLKDILPAGRTVRDYTPFETERGEGALLVLAVTSPVEPPEGPYPAEPNCVEMVEGVPLTGVYSIALVIRGVLVNEVAIPDGTVALPLRNRADFNARYWGQPVTGDPLAVEPTKLVRLADYDGDGHAFEFRLVLPEACRHVETLLAGYSPRRRQAVVFAVVAAGQASFWGADVFPVATGAGTGRLTSRSGCDHAAEENVRTKFRFDPRHELWRAVGTRRTPCPNAPGPAG
jgi:hypothetical protein